MAAQEAITLVDFGDPSMNVIAIFRQSVWCAHVFLDSPSKSTHSLAHQFSGESVNISALSKGRSTLLD